MVVAASEVEGGLRSRKCLRIKSVSWSRPRLVEKAVVWCILNIQYSMVAVRTREKFERLWAVANLNIPALALAHKNRTLLYSVHLVLTSSVVVLRVVEHWQLVFFSNF